MGQRPDADGMRPDRGRLPDGFRLCDPKTRYAPPAAHDVGVPLATHVIDIHTQVTASVPTRCQLAPQTLLWVYGRTPKPQADGNATPWPPHFTTADRRTCLLQIAADTFIH